MTSTTTDRMDNRFDVVSPAGVTLGVWVSGKGPPLVLVHGSITDHSTFNELVEELRDHVTTCAVDRRGFGVSGDTPEYAIEAEFEDIATVVDAVADRTGGPVALFGHSYGANSAMGAAAISDNVRRLMLFEPSLGIPGPPGSLDAMEAALARGDQEGAILEVLVGQIELTMEEVDALRASPRWPGLLAGAPTMSREGRTDEGWVYRGQFDAISCPTLFLSGSESSEPLRKATQQAVAAIRGARVRVLEGHGHIAHRAAPALVAGIVLEFLSS